MVGKNPPFSRIFRRHNLRPFVDGLVKSLSGEPYSTKSPIRKKALCRKCGQSAWYVADDDNRVILLRLRRASSILAVEIGPDRKSFIQKDDLGLHGQGPATQRRCCWPPESLRADSNRRSLTSSQRMAARRLCSTRSSRILRSFTRGSGAKGQIFINGPRQGIGLAKTMPPWPEAD